jgi:hypothetical protein
MDELTTMQETELSNFLFDTANGREKRKSKLSGTDLANTGSWDTITFLTSNRSIYELMRGISSQTTAESMRVVEICCNFDSYSGTPTGEYIEDVISLMADNYGLAGREFMLRCMTRDDDVFNTIALRARDWDKRVRQDSAERFWSYGLGIIIEAGRLAVEMGLLNYDMDALEAWVIDVLFPSMRDTVQDSIIPAESVLPDFLNTHLDNLLVVTTADRPPNMAEPPGSMIGMDPFILKVPMRQMHGRLEMDSKTVYLESKYLEAWCVSNRTSISTMLHELISSGVYHKGDKLRYWLGKDVRMYDNGRVLCYKFDLSKYDFQLGDQ